MTTAAKNAQKLLKLFGPKGEHWVKNWYAVDKTGESVMPRSRKAVKWCLDGACQKHKIDIGFLYDGLKKRGYGKGPINFNDEQKRFTPIKKLLVDIAKEGS